MKNKIMPFIIGVIVGVIISSVGFFIYNKVNVKESKKPEMTQTKEEGKKQQSKKKSQNNTVEELNDVENSSSNTNG